MAASDSKCVSVLKEVLLVVVHFAVLMVVCLVGAAIFFHIEKDLEYGAVDTFAQAFYFSTIAAMTIGILIICSHTLALQKARINILSKRGAPGGRIVDSSNKLPMYL